MRVFSKFSPFRQRFSSILLPRCDLSSVKHDRFLLLFDENRFEQSKMYFSSSLHDQLSGSQSGGLWQGSLNEIMLRKFEVSLVDNSVDEAWEAFNNFRKLYGYPEQHLVSKLVSLLSYSSSNDWIRKAYDLVIRVSKEKPGILHRDYLVRLALSLARAQMPELASTIIRIMLGRGGFPSVDILNTLFLHLVKSEVGSYLATSILMEICENVLVNESKFKGFRKTGMLRPSCSIFNLVLDSCIRFKSISKALEIIELMSRVGIHADANTVVIIVKIYEMIGERNALKSLKENVKRISSMLLSYHRQQIYDSLLSLHFKYKDFDAAATIMLDLYQCCESLHFARSSPKESQEQLFLQIGSCNFKMGYKIAIDAEQIQNNLHFNAQNQPGLVVFSDRELVPSNRALAKLINGFVKEKKVDKLSNFLINMQKEIIIKGSSLCSDVLDACIKMGWLDTAHDILDDLELSKTPIQASVYASLYRAYCSENKLEESKVLLKQMEKVGLINKFSNTVDSKYLKEVGTFNSLDTDFVEKVGLHKFLDLENRDYKVGSELVYEFNSSILFFTKAKMVEDTLRTLKQMKRNNVEPTVLTFSHVLSCYSSLRMYRDITILWGDIRRLIENGTLVADRDLYDCLLCNFLRGGYFERVMDIINCMLKHNIFIDKWRYRREFLNVHKNLYRNLKASDCRTEAQSKRLEHVQAFRKWVGVNQ